ncbi:MAG: hypothetical protein R2811_00120 [Flavobacteriales bacterium]
MFKRAVSRAFAVNWGWYFGSFSSSLATLTVVYKYLTENWLWVAGLTLGMFLFTLSIRVVIEYGRELEEALTKVQGQQEQIDQLKKDKKRILEQYEHYGESIIILKDSFSSINRLRRLGLNADSDLAPVMALCCNELKKLFEKRFPSFSYSVCIKVLGKDVDLTKVTAHAEVLTLCRDEESYKKRSTQAVIVHNIFENTCFDYIFHRLGDTAKSHYLNNDIPADLNYMNTSAKVWGELPDTDDIQERRKLWPLPYRSEIVVPITPIIPDEEGTPKQFLGFMCVDCNAENGFHKKYDAQLLRGVADGLFDLVRHHYKEPQTA